MKDDITCCVHSAHPATSVHRPASHCRTRSPPSSLCEDAFLMLNIQQNCASPTLLSPEHVQITYSKHKIINTNNISSTLLAYYWLVSNDDTDACHLFWRSLLAKPGWLMSHSYCGTFGNCWSRIFYALNRFSNTQPTGSKQWMLKQS